MIAYFVNVCFHRSIINVRIRKHCHAPLHNNLFSRKYYTKALKNSEWNASLSNGCIHPDNLFPVLIPAINRNLRRSQVRVVLLYTYISHLSKHVNLSDSAILWIPIHRKTYLSWGVGCTICWMLCAICFNFMQMHGAVSDRQVWIMPWFKNVTRGDNMRNKSVKFS